MAPHGQRHHSPNTLEHLELNTVFDGLFHAFSWIVTLAGIVLLLVAERPRRGLLSAFVGGLLIGWGLFDLVEGVVDHHLLGLHHVRPGPDEALYDLGFLVWGAAMLGAGLLWRSAERRSAAAGAAP